MIDFRCRYSIVILQIDYTLPQARQGEDAVFAEISYLILESGPFKLWQQTVSTSLGPFTSFSPAVVGVEMILLIESRVVRVLRVITPIFNLASTFRVCGSLPRST